MNRVTTILPAPSTSSPCGAAQQRLVAALAEYYEAIDARRPPDRAAFLKKYADIRDELTGYLDSFDLIGALAPELSRLSPPANTLSQQTSSPMVLGDFRILRELGRGGMGVVYEAEQLSLGRRVALKVLPFAAMLDKQQLNRFKNEARAAATLDHPNIVAIYSVGCERGVHYYAMQLIEGQSLAEVIEGIRNEERGASGEARGEAEGRRSRVEGQTNSAPLKGGGQVGAASRAALPNTSGVSDPSPARLAGPTNIDTATIAHTPTTLDAAQLNPRPSLLAPSSSLPDFGSREYFRAIAQLGIQAAEALDHAHQNGILHRDIKPANLLVECSHLAPRDETPTNPRRSSQPHLAERDDHSLKLWITDFGLARIEHDAGLTMTGDILGTLRYMSPEQALAKCVVVDHRSDIYSLGATLYELLTLQPVFAGDDRQELLRRIAFEEPAKPRYVNGQIPQDLETVILTTIEKNPADRYITAHDLAEDLRRFVASEPIKARAATPLQLAVKWSRRNPAAIWSAVFVLFCVTTASAVALVLVANAYQREAAQRMLAESATAKANEQARLAEREKEAAQASQYRMEKGFQLIRGLLGSTAPHMDKYEIWRGPDRIEKLRRSERPVLLWDVSSNVAEDSGNFGWTYIWSSATRPEVIGSVFTFPGDGGSKRYTNHELISVSSDPIQAEYRGKLVWEPSRPGIAFTAMPNVLPPAASPDERRTQIESIVGQFVVQAGADANGRTSKKVTLSPKLIYRYPKTSEPILDGAIIAFLDFGDPEALLLIEARHENAINQWVYGFASCAGSRELMAHHLGVEVWQFAGDDSEVYGLEVRKSPWTGFAVSTETGFPIESRASR